MPKGRPPVISRLDEIDRQISALLDALERQQSQISYLQQLVPRETDNGTGGQTRYKAAFDRWPQVR